ncbi:hypothetical protein Tsubulata_042260 [Turnera subulata]|uniref:Peptidase A1 domain-containing protein n=1 Tax=Turnera subulata TaxID=218843 RepID=A0A9Q0FEJ9_9ROSI|nr:hypothetical protein Tsubulata_042260 [Turnera subulata]
MSYGDGSSSAGLLAYDTFRFGNTKVSNIAFGRGHQNEGFVNSGGILGLGRGDLSFLNQLGGKSAGIFSYCLVEPGSEAWGWLEIGDETIASGAAWIPIMYNPRADPSYYYVGLSGIKVENMVVPIPEQAFQLNYKGEGGVILDTGTVITRFPTAAYDTFRDAFLAQMEHVPRTHGVSILDTCFNLTSTSPLLWLPHVSFHFTGGVTLTLKPNNVFVEVETSRIFCLAFAPSPKGFSILGNIAQQAVQIAVDARSGRIGFRQQGWNKIRNESWSSSNVSILPSITSTVLLIISLYYMYSFEISCG